MDLMRETPNWGNLEIRGFRGLERLELSRLGSFNVLLGVNDVGKTSVLEAIFLLSGLGSIGLPIRVQHFRNYLVEDVDDLLSLLYGQDAGKTATLTASSPGGLDRSTLSISVMDVEGGCRGEHQANRKVGRQTVFVVDTHKTSRVAL